MELSKLTFCIKPIVIALTFAIANSYADCPNTQQNIECSSIAAQVPLNNDQEHYIEKSIEKLKSASNQVSVTNSIQLTKDQIVIKNGVDKSKGFYYQDQDDPAIATAISPIIFHQDDSIQQATHYIPRNELQHVELPSLLMRQQTMPSLLPLTGTTQQPIDLSKLLRYAAATKPLMSPLSLLDQQKNTNEMKLEYLTHRLDQNKASLTNTLLYKFNHINESAIFKIGYQLGSMIMDNIAKSVTTPLTKPIKLNGGYIIDSINPYVYIDDKDGTKMTGNITIYDNDSTKVYINNTTIYFEGSKSVSGIDVVDVKQNSAGLGSIELSRFTHINQRRIAEKTKQNKADDPVNLIGYINANGQTKNTKKEKIDI